MAENKETANTGNTSAIKNFLAGGVGGVCLVAAGHPLDTIKVDVYAYVSWDGMFFSLY